MDRLQEIATRKAELKAQLESEEKGLDLDAIKNEIDALEVEEKSIKESAEAEARKAAEEAEARRKEAEELEKKNLAKPIEKKEEKKSMENIYATKEYKSAWLKHLMGVKLDEAETKALGDAVGTTATTFVESDESTQGINNLGLLIPTELRKELMEVIFRTSPFLADVRKLAVKGNVDLPYLFAADDAAWYTELTDTANEGQEYKNLQLTGWELAKDIEITWKAEEMTVEGFEAFLLEELSMKMGKALATAVIYGNGSSKPTGAIYGLEAITGSDPIKLIADTKATLSQDDKVGAVAYISENVNDAIVFQKDNIGHYPYLMGIPSISNLNVKVDPFLTGGDIIVGNPMRYVLNEVRPVSVEKEKKVKGRRTIYGAYGIFDGKPKPNAFAKGTLVSASI